MQNSCASAVSVDFDRELALLHNFWYARAFERFNQVARKDPECAMAYWGAAMTYNHPFWDPPSQADETAAWAVVQKGLKARHASTREKLYLAAVAALYKDAGARKKSMRDENYRDAMAVVYAKYPDDETKLFYGLSILGAIPEGTRGFEQQGQAVFSAPSQDIAGVGTGSGSQFGNQNGDFTPTGLWFETSVFTKPAAETFGNQPRNNLRNPLFSPPMRAFGRTFQIRERLTFQFHFDVFDFLNHPNWDGPNSNPTSGGFGTITGKSNAIGSGSWC
jgi:hypothetical protein